MAKKKEVKEESLEKQLWKSADKLRKNIDAAEYKHVVSDVPDSNLIKSKYSVLNQFLI